MSDTIPPSCRVPAFVGNKQIKFIEKDVPMPGRSQLLLRVGANALCGSERPQFFDGSAVTPGHEAAGAVVAPAQRLGLVIGVEGQRDRATGAAAMRLVALPLLPARWACS